MIGPIIVRHASLSKATGRHAKIAEALPMRLCAAILDGDHMVHREAQWDCILGSMWALPP